MANSRPILHINNLALHFDDGRTKALDGIHLDIQEGEFVAIAGPSGCGKSSLLNVIGTLDRPTAGEIRFRAERYAEIRDFSVFRRQHFGFVFQSFHLIPTLSALDNVVVPTIGCPGRSQDNEKRARSLLVRLGLESRLDQFPGKLSGGERQRVAIARALINDPEVVLADEPTGSLDSTNAKQVLDLLVKIRSERKLTVIMVTHDPQVSSRADRVVCLSDGRVHTDSAYAG